VKVSTLCLGAMTFGEADANSFMHGIGCDEKTSFAIMDRSLDAGINFFDVADVYGQDGLSERVIGNWFESTKKRDQIVLATKFRFMMGTGPNKSGAARYRIVRCVEESLRRLKTDRIELYQIHAQDLAVREEETLRALDDLVRQGKVLHVGASNYTATRLMDALWTSETRGLEKFCTLQALYNLFHRNLERELVPTCARWEMGVIAYSPLAGGFLSGKYRRGADRPTGTRLEKFKERFAQMDNDRGWSIVEEVAKVAEETSSPPSAVALAWLLRQRCVTSLIFGARTVAQLEDNLKAADVKLGDEQVARLEKVSAMDWGYPYDFLGRMAGGRWS